MLWLYNTKAILTKCFEIKTECSLQNSKHIIALLIKKNIFVFYLISLILFFFFFLHLRLIISIKQSLPLIARDPATSPNRRTATLSEIISMWAVQEMSLVDRRKENTQYLTGHRDSSGDCLSGSFRCNTSYNGQTDIGNKLILFQC